jgi:drug/metabolite transporter (DMT)-like permease
MKDLARRVNFFTASFIGILGLSLIGEVIMEHDMEDKVDDILMVILGLAAIYWYRRTGHKLNKTIGSVVIVGIAVLIKVYAIYIEHADKEAVGDDFGILAALIIALIFIIWQTLRNKK